MKTLTFIQCLLAGFVLLFLLAQCDPGPIGDPPKNLSAYNVNVVKTQDTFEVIPIDCGETLLPICIAVDTPGGHTYALAFCLKNIALTNMTDINGTSKVINHPAKKEPDFHLTSIAGGGIDEVQLNFDFDDPFFPDGQDSVMIISNWEEGNSGLIKDTFYFSFCENN